MIEFLHRPYDQDELIILNVSAVASFEPHADGRTEIRLRNGRVIWARLAYAELRDLLVQASSQFVSAVSKDGQ